MIYPCPACGYEGPHEVLDDQPEEETPWDDPATVPVQCGGHGCGHYFSVAFSLEG